MFLFALRAWFGQKCPSMSHKSGLSIKYYILLRSSCASQSPKGVIYGHSKKIIYEHLWLIDGHLWRKKTKTFMTKHCFMRQPNPERGYLWTFKKNNLWTFMAHWWTFMTKKTKTFVTKNKYLRRKKQKTFMSKKKREHKQKWLYAPIINRNI